MSLHTVEVPAIVKETEVLIEVRAASLDPVDLKVMHWFQHRHCTVICDVCLHWML